MRMIIALSDKRRASSRAEQGSALRSREISFYLEKDLSTSAALRLSVEMTHFLTILLAY
jgi:hypothetical protein